MTVQVERPLDEQFLIELVPRSGSFGRTGAARAADVTKRTAVGDQLLQTGAQESPRTHVFGFLLQPDDIAYGRVAREHVVQRDLWKRIELLDAAEGDVLCRRAAFAGDEVHVHLAAAEHHAVDRAPSFRVL